jgi:hypothetical protein
MEARPWLLVTVSTAGAPAALRVTVWRKLKQLGALYLQQSACLLPKHPSVTRAISQLQARVVRDGGTIRVLTIRFEDPAEEHDVVEELRSARESEYREVLTHFPTFFDELRMETARGRTTFEEVEECEADLVRFRTWISKIRSRDYFAAELGEHVQSELGRAEEEMARFADAAMAASDLPDAQAPEQAHAGNRLRSV